MPRYEFEQFAAVRNYSDLSFDADGSNLAYVTNASGQFNVWRHPVDPAPDGHPLMPVQLTALVEEAARRAAWSPSGEQILTLADRHGTENYQIYRIPAEQGWLYPITQKPDVRHEIGSRPFNPDGSVIAYGSNERARQDFDVLIYHLRTGETKTLLAGDANYFPHSWSPDGRYVLAIKHNRNTDSDLYLCDTQTGETHLLTPHEDEAKYYPGAWDPAGRGFYLLTDYEREFTGLAYYDLQARSYEWLETPEWDIYDTALSSDGRYLIWAVNEDGYSLLYARDLQTREIRTYPNLPRGVYLGLTPNPKRPLIGFYISRPSYPSDLYLLDVETGDYWKLTQSFLGGVPESEMVEPELVRYSTFDGRSVPAFLYKPKDLTAREKVPVVLSIHGGPEAQERPGYAYNGFYQYLLNRKIGVLAPNIRGSTGYGKSYQKLIHRDWGGAELKDLEHAALYLRSLSWVDSDRLGVFGGSFGGFAVLSCVSRLPEYWAAAVDIVGPSNLLTFVKSVPPFWQRFMKQWVGDPEEDAEMLWERSPIKHVDNVRAPLLIIQGANDPRVVKAESDQMVERLQALGRTVEYCVFEDEGHGFTKVSNWLKALRASADWFTTHLNKE